MNIHEAESFKDFEEKFKFLFDNAADPIFILDNKGKFIQINKKVKEILGYREKDLIGKKFTEMNILTKKSKLIALENFIKRMAGFEIKPYEIEIIKKNGEIVIGEINASAIKENGKTIGDMVICRDVTEKRKIEQKLIESEQKYRLIFEEANDGILVADVKTMKFNFANPKICEITGYSLKELLKISVDKIHPKKDLPYVLDQFRKQVERKIDIAKDIPVLRKDKKIVFCDVNSKNIDIKGKKCIIGFFRDITERKKAEQVIKESEEKYKAIVENATDWIFLLDTKLRYISLNKAVTNILHSTASKLIGKSALDMFPKEIAANFARNNYEVIKTSKSKFTEEKMVVNGRDFYISTSLNPLKNSKGKVTAVMGIVRDITKLKKTQEEIGEKAKVIDSMADGLWMLDVNGNTVDVNPEIEKIFGYSRKELQKINPTQITAKRDLPKTFELIKNAFKKSTAIGELTGVRKDGKEIPLWISVSVIKDAKGKVTGQFAILRDMTEMKKAQEELKESEAKYKTILESGNDGVLAVDAQTKKFIFLNKQMETITGYNRKELFKITTDKIHPEKDRKWIMQEFQKVATGKSELAVGIPVERKNKEIIICDIRAIVTQMEGRPVVIAFFRDVTEQKKAEEEVATAWKYSENLIANMPSSVLVFDDKLKCTSANWMYYQTFKKNIKHIEGNDITHTLPSGMIIKHHLDEKVKEVLKTEKTIELPKCQYNNEIYNVKIVKIMKGKAEEEEEEERFVMVIIDDVTEKVKAEEEIKKARDELADKVAELERFSKVAVGRELKMVELKKRIGELERQLDKGQEKGIVIK
jgi:PAS domain S-box-containing protein